MARRPVLVVVAVAAVVAGVALGSAAMRARPAVPAAAPSAAAGRPAAPIAVAPAAPADDPLAGFAQWTQPRRMQVLAKLSEDPRLDERTIAFLGAELGDRSLDASSRNNIANVLIAQDAKDPALAQRLMAMVDDPAESLTWRDYALQHLVRTVPFSPDPQAITAKLVALSAKGATGEGTLPGTALLQLAQLQRTGAVTLGDDYAKAVATMATDPRVGLENRMSAVGLIGQCGLKAQAPTVRTLVAQAKEPALVRVALATLGLVGDASDVPLLEKYLTDPNQAVALAAKGALVHLKDQSAL